MTKDLALLIGPDQKWLTTEGFLDKVDENLKKAMSRRVTGARVALEDQPGPDPPRPGVNLPLSAQRARPP